MILAHLTRHWLARREQYSFTSWVLCIARTLRVLVFYRDHQRLCRLDVYRNYVAAPPNDDLFHHLSHRDYLVKNLGARRRIACALHHYSFEDETFNTSYKYAVYRSGGLTLWQRSAGGSQFAIRLAMASRMNAEGDLTVAFEADGKCLHRLSFSWIEGSVVGVDTPVVPFVARNQGRWTDSDLAFAAFEQAFPNNSPSFFCFAAMQGVAQAVGMTQLVAIKASAHPAYDPDAVKNFANAYDGFWKILGGVELPGAGYLVALPFYVKPLTEMPRKHRKRAAIRRENWAEIGEAARGTLERKLKRSPLPAPRPAALRETEKL
ncbi:MAG: hypothetical protein JWQ01_2439 [Massilia sp.]|jgi:uncharacterized protein VirK/YbjX|nr:hypothetical protein [Massilia sp.]